MEGQSKGLDSFVQLSDRLGPALLIAQRPRWRCPGYSGPWPILGELVAAGDAEGVAVGLDRLIEPPPALRPAQPHAQGPIAMPRLFWVVPQYWGK